MEPSLIKSVPDAYSIYLMPDGSHSVVLHGLSLSDAIVTHPIQNFIGEHYQLVLIAYCFLLIGSLMYVFVKNVGLPLYRHFKHKAPYVY